MAGESKLCEFGQAKLTTYRGKGAPPTSFATVSGNPAVEFVGSYDATQKLIREQANHLNVPGYGRN